MLDNAATDTCAIYTTHYACVSNNGDGGRMGRETRRPSPGASTWRVLRSCSHRYQLECLSVLQARMTTTGYG
jgi:hypothetical protein